MHRGRGTPKHRPDLLSGSTRALLILTLLVAGADRGWSQDSVARGRRLADDLCAECHRVDSISRPRGGPAPDFVAVAQAPSTTGVALSVFLQQHHPGMPSFQLSREERDALIDYILSLRSRASGSGQP
ncbi:hypothetical protein M446_1579 [Methylobacterium sp. 4-46]|uniref:c-type cytochrome n=1 Tax=unclassified Methylobacterium TaxID=2615210 RepID=UPI000152CEDC|nr:MULTISPECIES: cytochrome c [Methylobacterium]ACA16080.1 hypothetical protein M446_1579 [Methylobacterium sp. 4-46]WFT81791.1 cytochrome c [Methylobacterium nodulans]